MYCPMCGNETPDHWAFCQACGARLTQVDNQAQAAPFDQATPVVWQSQVASHTYPAVQVQQQPALVATSEAMAVTAAPQRSWYYLSGSERLGPVEEAQIPDLAKAGTIDRNTLVWSEGLSGWYRAEDTVLRPVVQSVLPPAPANALSDRWLWSLATIPLLCSFLLSLFVPASWSLVITVIVVILNIVFLSLDSQDLKKSGVNVESWLWLGIVLVPVYLFVRAAKTTNNPAPGIVWCVLFFLSLL